jgi:N utilization substance protein B
MFNRRYLRIKVFQALYAYWQDESANRGLQLKNLATSLQRARDLFHFLLLLPQEFRHHLTKELDIQKSKHFPSEQVIRPLEAIISNKAINMLEQNESLAAAAKASKLIWTGTDTVFRDLYAQLKTSAALAEYMNATEHTFTDDKKLLGELYQLFIADSELLDQYLDERFINWEDDQAMVVALLLKTIGQLKEDQPVMELGPLVDKDSEREDKEMLHDLFEKTIEQDEELEKLISVKTENWEADRIAMVDMLLMKMALCEILNFPYIPVKVSINEYLELAKLYSTPQSHGFINGILDKIQLELRKENKITKQGRGLVE